MSEVFSRSSAGIAPRSPMPPRRAGFGSGNIRWHARHGVLFVLALFAALRPLMTATGAEAGPLTLDDLPAYEAALERPDSSPGVDASFHALWDNPRAFEGRLVRVRGRASRRFAQAAAGRFPALTELWITDPAGNPLCLVYPTGERAADLRIGASVEFAGTYLRRIRYHGSDGERLAPLVVGPVAPRSTPAQTRHVLIPDRATQDWAVGIGLGIVVVAVLGSLHFRRPIRRRVVAEPAPPFVTAEDLRADGSATEPPAPAGTPCDE